jgi:CBS domain-containing protein
MPVSAVMSHDVLVVDAQDPIIEVWQRMQDLGTPVAAVCEGTRIIAVISQHTLAMWWPSGGPHEMHRRRVRNVIDPGTPVVHPDTTVRKTAGLINDFRLDGVPVVTAGGALLGLVTPTELVRLLADTSAHPVTANEC